MSVRLARGVQVRLDTHPWRILQVDYRRGYVRLGDEQGEQATMALEEFITHPQIEEVAPSEVRTDAAATRIDARAREVLAKRIAHVYEAETGYRSGTALQALPGEPRAEYDPATTSLTQRRHTKARELDNEHAADAGTKMSVMTLRRIGLALRHGRALDDVVDHRLVRRSPGRLSINEHVEAACQAVFEKTRDDSNRTHSARYLLVRQYLREVYGYTPGREPVPSERTIRRWFQDRFVPSELNGKARTRRSATTAPSHGFSRPNPTRPGELVCIDTCSLDVLLTGTSSAGLVRGVLVMAVDWYSRSIVALRVLERAEQDIDVTFLLREIGRPKPMLPGWGDEHRWPFVGLPEQMLCDVYGGSGYSGMPFVNAEAIVTDHGSTYKAHLNVAAATQQGISILPARVRTGSDKQVIERTFGAMRTMLLQFLPGYRGADVTERGANIDAQVALTAGDIEDLVCSWVVRVWQNHELSDARPQWCPEGAFSPNTLYEYGLAQSGMPLRAMSSNDYYALLPAVHVKVHSRGVSVKGLWYDGPCLNQPNVRTHPSPYGGAVKGMWTVRYDKRDLRRVFFLDREGVYQPLTWVGLSRHTPSFNDRHAAALSKLRRERGIGPHHNEILAEILLSEVLGAYAPVEKWSGLDKDSRRIIADNSRAHRQAQMIQRDRGGTELPHPQGENGACLSDCLDTSDSRVPSASDQPQNRRSAPNAVAPTAILGPAREQDDTDSVALGQRKAQAPRPRPDDAGTASIFGIDMEALRAARDDLGVTGWDLPRAIDDSVPPPAAASQWTAPGVRRDSAEKDREEA